MPVISDPSGLLGKFSTAKHARECTELYLAHKKLQHLAGLEAFSNLQSLWINNNNLVAIDNLDRNVRLKALYAHANAICTLKGSVKRLKSLRVLDLSCNCIRDVQKVKKTLAGLANLETLNLVGNPCCEETDYRHMLIHSLPSLRLLDGHIILDMERTKAKVTFGCAHEPRFAFYSALPKQLPANSPVEQQSYHEKLTQGQYNCIRVQRKLAAENAVHSLRDTEPHPALHRVLSLPRPPGWVKAGCLDNQHGEGPVLNVGPACATEACSDLHRCRDVFSYYIAGTEASEATLPQIGHPAAAGSPFDKLSYHQYTAQKQRRGGATVNRHTMKI